MAIHDPIPDEIRDVSPNDDCLMMTATLPTASPQCLFRYWSEPALLETGWSTVAEVEPGPNGSYHLSWPVPGWHLRGSFTAWDPDRKIGFTWRWDHHPEDVVREVEVMFVARSGGTQLTLAHGLYGGTERDQARRREHRDGWFHFLGRLQSVVAATAQ